MNRLLEENAAEYVELARMLDSLNGVIYEDERLSVDAAKRLRTLVLDKILSNLGERKSLQEQQHDESMPSGDEDWVPDEDNPWLADE